MSEPGQGLRPLGRRLAWGRRRVPEPRRLRLGTGEMRPRAISIVRMRPVVLSETAQSPRSVAGRPAWPCPTSDSRRASPRPPPPEPETKRAAAPAARAAPGSEPSDTASPARRRPHARASAALRPSLRARCRRETGSSCKLTRQATNLHGGPPSSCLSINQQLRGPEPSLKGRVSHMSEPGQPDGPTVMSQGILSSLVDEG